MEIVQFCYDSPEQEAFVERKLFEIQTWGRKGVDVLIKVGGLLIEIKRALSHGKWTPWLETHGFQEDSARRYMKLSAMATQIPQIACFPSMEAAWRFADMLPEAQQAILEQEAWERPDLMEQVAWDATMRAHLADLELPDGRRCGDVYDAICDAKDDPVLAEVAAQLYEEYREDFAYYADRDPPELDAEMGTFNVKPTNGEKPCWGGMRRFAIFEEKEDGWVFHSAVTWIGLGGIPILAFPDRLNGPTSRALQADTIKTVSKKLCLASPQTIAERSEQNG